MAKSFLDSFKGLTKKKGTKDKEIEKYEKILGEQPDDRNALNALGDLYAKSANADKACEYYLRVGSLYAKDGFTLKAIAVYKKAQRAKPDVVQTYLDLADLYVQKGLIGEAKTNYLTAAEMQAAAGAKHESLDTYHKIADLDPNNTNIRSKLAAMYEKEEFFEDAAIIYAEIGDAVFRQDVKEGKKFYQRARKLQPDNHEILSRIGYSYAEQAMKKEATEIFQKLLELEPGNIDYKEQLEELAGPSQPPAAVPAAAPVSSEITFSEEELGSLNFGEEPVADIQDISGVNMEDVSEAQEHILEFPSTDASSETNATEQGAEDHSLDFYIEAQEPVAWDSPPQEQTPVSETVPSQEDHSLEFNLEDSNSGPAVTPQANVTSPADTSGTSEYYDLASRLDTAVQLGREYENIGEHVKIEASSEIATSEISDLIKEFKQGVLEEVGTEDYETHYELGISYKEMSLLDDAIEELKLASLEPSKFVECQGVIGLCYLEKGDYNSAIQAFQEARARVEPQGENYQNLTYQIALSYEKTAQVEEAVQEFQALFQIHPDYRDVRQRLNRLLG